MSDQTSHETDDERARLIEMFAEKDGRPLPADWRDPDAVQARQDHLEAVAHIAGAATLELAVCRSLDLEPGVYAPVVRAFAEEVCALDQAMRDYTQMTQRGDADEIVQEALEASAGGALAAFVTGSIERIRADEMARIRAAGLTFAEVATAAEVAAVKAILKRAGRA